ncbi:MAG: TIGR02300 family protein [Rhodospirillales bacterium]|nr:TIGR02300 family protein [Rhodospirillales bacterium]MCW9002099.1 TIGR02300 family protein [Rhodospirillales bacterium]MCW9039838.1 TIGR02300 family protein [Rhodospirillales bacterium]
MKCRLAGRKTGGSVSKPEWGTKRVCGSCAAPFYDMRRTPPVCPKCETVWEAPKVSRAKRGAAEAKPAKPVKEVVAEVKKKSIPVDDDGDDDDVFEIEADDDFAVDDDDDDDDLIEDASDLDDDDIVDVRGRRDDE